MKSDRRRGKRQKQRGGSKAAMPAASSHLQEEIPQGGGM